MVAYGTTYVNNILPFIPLVGTLVHSITPHKHHMNTSTPHLQPSLPPCRGLWMAWLASAIQPTNQPTKITNQPNPPTNLTHPTNPSNQPTNQRLPSRLVSVSAAATSALDPFGRCWADRVAELGPPGHAGVAWQSPRRVAISCLAEMANYPGAATSTSSWTDVHGVHVPPPLSRVLAPRLTRPGRCR